MSFQLFIMTYVGIATSLGLVIEVLMVLQSLSVSLAAAPNADLPIPFDLGFIAMLDSGNNDSEFNRIVKSYAMAWWKGARKPADGGTLTAKTLTSVSNNITVCYLKQWMVSPCLNTPSYQFRPYNSQLVLSVLTLVLIIAPSAPFTSHWQLTPQ